MEFPLFLQQYGIYILIGFLILLMFKNRILAKVYGLQTISTQDAFEHFKKKSKNTVFLDVSTPWEWERNPRIKRSKLIPLSELSNRFDEVKQYASDKKIIVVCYSGRRSVNAGVKLKRAGFSDVYTMAGGIIRWENASYPVIRKKSKTKSTYG